MTPHTDDWREQEKSFFEQNMLDGDDVHDCGGAMIAATEVLDYTFERVAAAEQRGYERGEKEEREKVREWLSKKRKTLEREERTPKNTDPAFAFFHGYNVACDDLVAFLSD